MVVTVARQGPGDLADRPRGNQEWASGWPGGGQPRAALGQGG